MLPILLYCTKCIFLFNILNYLKELLLLIYYFIDRFREFCEVKGRSAHFKSSGRRYKLFRAVTVGHCQRSCCSYVVAFLDVRSIVHVLSTYCPRTVHVPEILPVRLFKPIAIDRAEISWAICRTANDDIWRHLKTESTVPMNKCEGRKSFIM